MKGCNVDTLTDSTTDLTKQLNESHAAGAQLVRWQLVNEPAAMSNWSFAEYDQWLANRLWILDQCMPTIVANNQFVIIDFHHTCGGKKGSRWQVFYDGQCKQHHLSTLQHVARRYRDNDHIWAIEPFNEPKPESNAQLRNFYIELIPWIRNEGFNKWIIIDHVSDDCDNIKNITPLDDDKLIYSVHFYKPGEVIQANGRVVNVDKAKLRELLKYPIKFAIKYGKPMIVGEFGCVKTSGKSTNQRPFLNNCKAVFDEFGWNWCLHTHSYNKRTNIFQPSDEQFYSFWK